jgi:DNA polymerase-3 subunit beta
MKFSVTKSILENIVTNTVPFLEKKDNSSITSHILFEVDNSNLTIKATDYEMGLVGVIENLEDSINGKATVNGKNLLEIIRRLKDQNITIHTEDDLLIIEQNSSIFKLHTYNPEEYPEFPNSQNLKELSINNYDLINSIKKITPSIDNNNPKYELNGALIQIDDDSINFVSTDTKRLSVVSFENNDNFTTSLIIPKKAIVEIGKLFLNDFKIKYDETNLVIESNEYRFYTKLLNGNFPDYKRIIPSEVRNSINLPKDKIIESIKLVTAMTPNVEITILNNTITFNGIDDNNDNEAKTQIEIENLNIEDKINLKVNSRYILDFLNSINTNQVELGFNDYNLPFYLKDDNFKAIIMPIFSNS